MDSNKGKIDESNANNLFSISNMIKGQIEELDWWSSMGLEIKII